MKAALLLPLLFAMAPAPAAAETNVSGYEQAIQCFKLVIRTALYEKLLISMKALPADSSNEALYSEWQNDFRNILRWEGKRLGKSDAEMMTDVRNMADALRQEAASSSSNVIISSYKQSLDGSNKCRNLF